MNRFVGNVGLVLLTGVLTLSPAQGFAGDLTAAVKAAAVAAAQEGGQVSARDWQRQYDRAQARKGSGKSKIVLGAILLGGGIGFRNWAVGRCTPDFSDPESFDLGGCATAAKLVDVANIAVWSGVGVAGWGVAQYVMARGQVNRLEAQRPDDTARIQAPAFRLAAVTAPVSYTLRW